MRGATDPNSPVKGITVQGTGRITISPDLATVSIGVQSQAPRAAQAQAKASAAMNGIIAAVKKAGDVTLLVNNAGALTSYNVLASSQADLDAEDGSFHGPGFTGHHGFRRQDVAAQLHAAGFRDAGITTVLEIEKQTAAGIRRFPVFLAIARRDP